MSERYSKLFALPENLYAAGSPVVIAAGALLKDNQTSKVIAQLKMRNISQKPIKAAKVSIHPLDTVGNPLGEKIEYQYLDLSAARDEDFGQKAPVALADASTRSFTASVEEIVFADNSIWTATGEPWEVLDTPGSLRSIGDAELIKQYRLKYGNNCKNLPLLHKDLWYCACGELNRQGEAECHRCQKSLALLEQIDMDELRKEKDDRLVAEKEQAEKEAAAAKAHAKKMGKIAAIVVPILVVLIVAAVIISNSVKKSNAYENALTLLDAGQYTEAIEAFIELGDYKDCAEQIQIAENAHAEEEKAQAEAVIEAEKNEKYSRAVLLLASGNYEKYAEAYQLFLELGDHKDAASYLSDFQYLLLNSKYLIENGATTSYVYDSHGRVAEKWLGEHQVYKYNYSDDGTYSSDYYVSERLMYTYRYNIHGDMTHEISHYADGEHIYEWEYAEDGMSKTRKVIKDSQVSQTRVFPLDEYGNSLIDESWFEYKFTYDDYGRIIRSEKYWNDEFREYTNYTYDKYGNVVSLERGDASGFLDKQEYELTYGYIYCPDAA